MPVIVLGIELLTTIVVGEPFVFAAKSPEAQPGNPPVGCHRPAVDVQFANGGGALVVTTYPVDGLQTANAVASANSARLVARAAVITRRLTSNRIADNEDLGRAWYGREQPRSTVILNLMC